MTNLGEHLGEPILKTRVAITNAGDGLSKALAIDPQVIGRDDQVCVVLRCSLKDHKLEWYENADEQIAGWELTNRLRAGLATIVPLELVEELLDQQQAKLDEAAGVVRIPFGEDPDEDSALHSEALEAEVASLAGRKGRKGEAGLRSIDEPQEASGGD